MRFLYSSLLLTLALLLGSKCRIVQQSSEKISASKTPVFRDSTVFIDEIKTSSTITDYYTQLKGRGDNATYEYSFIVSNDGSVLPRHNSNKNQLYRSLNDFVKRTFDTYKWIHPTGKDCLECKTYGRLRMFLMPDNKVIAVEIEMSDGVMVDQDVMLYRKDISMF